LSASFCYTLPRLPPYFSKFFLGYISTLLLSPPSGPLWLTFLRPFLDAVFESFFFTFSQRPFFLGGPVSFPFLQSPQYQSALYVLSPLSSNSSPPIWFPSDNRPSPSFNTLLLPKDFLPQRALYFNLLAIPLPPKTVIALTFFLVLFF